MKKFIINACIVFLGILFAVLVVADIGLVGAAIEHREYTYFIAVAVSIVINVLIWTAVTKQRILPEKLFYEMYVVPFEKAASM